ncbi:MAG: CDF family zinc transporter ZitB [Myxococcota bacterium]
MNDIRRDDSYAHNHPPVGSNAAEKALIVAFSLNLAFLIIELVAGIFANSLALLSDAGHMVSDIASLGLALFAERISRIKPAGIYTFGFKRAPVLGAFGNSLALLAIVGIIFWKAGERLYESPEISSIPVLIVGVAGLFVNLASALWLHRSGEKSVNIKGAILHLLADALGSIGAIVSSLVMLFSGWTPIDSIVSFLIGGLILMGTVPLLAETTKVLLQAAPTKIDVARLREAIRKLDEVEELLDLHLWELNTGQLVLTAVLITADCSVSSAEETSDRLREMLKREYGVEHSTFEWRTSSQNITPCE